MSFADQVNKAVQDNPVRSFVNYGKCKMELEYTDWTEGAPKLVSQAVYDKLPADKRSCNALFVIESKGFSPQGFEYTRRVKIGSTDWAEITERSILEMTAGAPAKFYDLAEAGNVWVAFEDKPSGYQIMKKTGKPLGIPSFIKFFTKQSEAVADMDARYKKSGSSNGSVTKLDPKAMEEATAMWQLVNGNEEKFKVVAADEPWSPYISDIIAILKTA